MTNTHRPIYPPTVQAAAVAAVGLGATLGAVASAVDCDTVTVRAWRRKAGACHDLRSERGNGRCPWDDEPFETPLARASLTRVVLPLLGRAPPGLTYLAYRVLHAGAPPSRVAEAINVSLPVVWALEGPAVDLPPPIRAARDLADARADADPEHLTHRALAVWGIRLAAALRERGGWLTIPDPLRAAVARALGCGVSADQVATLAGVGRVRAIVGVGRVRAIGSASLDPSLIAAERRDAISSLSALSEQYAAADRALLEIL